MQETVSGAVSESAIEIRNLRKSYPTGFLHRGRRVALADVSFEVPRGEIFGYLGPNGAGKTTTLKILMGLVFADSGTAAILGRPMADRAWRQAVGYLPENPYLYDYLTSAEYLDYVGRLFGMPAAARRERRRELLRRVDLEDSARLPLRQFSKGMLQRAGLAQALMNDPELVILDEPMSGLDPIGRRLVRDLLLELKQRGKTVFFSTHILPDAETLCDRVGLLREGRVVEVGRLDEILKIDVEHLEVLVTGVDEQALGKIGPRLKARQSLGERWRLEVTEGDLASVVGAIEAAGGRILLAHPVRKSLEDVFLERVGEGRAGGGAA
jgi:ABC-2 type transport system ATP-binding protein